jgi:hypothetical protein
VGSGVGALLGASVVGLRVGSGVGALLGAAVVGLRVGASVLGLRVDSGVGALLVAAVPVVSVITPPRAPVATARSAPGPAPPHGCATHQNAATNNPIRAATRSRAIARPPSSKGAEKAGAAGAQAARAAAGDFGICLVLERERVPYDLAPWTRTI